MVHGAVPPHWTTQADEPAHSAVHPPFGQSMVQELDPVHEIFDPVSRVSPHVLPPAQVTWLLTPVVSVHWLVPAQLETQFEVHVPPQTDCPSQVFVHPVPQDRSHRFFESQWYVTLSGGTAPEPAAASTPVPPSSDEATPRAHVPPL
jgi:hypothetical protein